MAELADALASGASLSNRVQVQVLFRGPDSIRYMINNKILNFYQQTSLYTDLGLYKNFAQNLPDDIGKLCQLQRAQIIHPFHLLGNSDRSHDPFYGDLTSVPPTSLPFENDLFPTAQSMIAELLRRDPRYGLGRKTEDKLHLCCREQAVLLASILKAKGVAARVRSGFERYSSPDGDGTFGDHWITEYYNPDLNRWALVDVDLYFPPEILHSHRINLDLLDLPRSEFLFAAEAYLGLRQGAFGSQEIYYASSPLTFGLDAAVRALFYDFHSLMNDEILFTLVPKYILDKDFQLSPTEYAELDDLAQTMLDPDQNFDKLREIWMQNLKFRIMSGGFNA